MEIPQEIIKSRHFTAYLDTDPELLFLVEIYNEKMKTARRQFRSLLRLENVFLTLNIAALIILGMIPSGGIFLFDPRIVWLEWTALGVFAAAFLYFGIWKRNFIAMTAFSALLLLTDARFAVMLAVNAVLAVIHGKNRRVIASREGYPFFAGIHIEKKNCKEPKNHEEPLTKPNEQGGHDEL